MKALAFIPFTLLVGCSTGYAPQQADGDRFAPQRGGRGYLALPNVGEARLHGSIDSVPVDEDARVRIGAGFGTMVIELAAPTERAAVMHRLEFDRTTFALLEPGDALQYRPDDPQPDLLPLACAGAVLDDWTNDVAIDAVDLEVSEGDEPDELRVDWQVASSTSADGRPETSQGFVVFSP